MSPLLIGIDLVAISLLVFGLFLPRHRRRDLVVSGGTTTVAGLAGNGNGSLDSNGAISVTGGTLVAAGSGGMAEAPD